MVQDGKRESEEKTPSKPFLPPLSNPTSHRCAHSHEGDTE